MIVAVVFDLGILFIFKYLNFVVDNVNCITGKELHYTNIALPIGISFFTFQALSYVIDVYRGDVKPQKNILNVALYISFFPQLIAGPIIRYQTIGDKLAKRDSDAETVAEGIKKFITGLGKKVIISNQLAIVADTAFGAVGNMEDISIVFAWTGAVAYAFQIYFDFDGYSQMAIGLGKIFGFDFPENFDYPYISKSITEFWHRWHISLSTWFRDYLYIPLGGNRGGPKKHLRNLLIVWLATGLWHGADWTFVLWGLIYFVLLVLEKFGSVGIMNEKMPLFFRHMYTLLFVIIAWVFFRADSIEQAVAYVLQMFGKSELFVDNYAIQYLNEYKMFLTLAFLCSFRFFKKINLCIQKNVVTRAFFVIAEPLVYMCIFAISASYLITGGYNPFIYFNF